MGWVFPVMILWKVVLIVVRPLMSRVTLQRLPIGLVQLNSWLATPLKLVSWQSRNSALLPLRQMPEVPLLLWTLNFSMLWQKWITAGTCLMNTLKLLSSTVA